MTIVEKEHFLHYPDTGEEWLLEQNVHLVLTPHEKWPIQLTVIEKRITELLDAVVSPMFHSEAFLFLCVFE